MANSNFVVHNGLTVGPLTIDAATGDINTPGNVNISGNIDVSSIQKGDSSIAITDTGSNSTVVITVDGTNRSNINTSGMYLTGLLNVSGNISGANLTGSLLNVSGNISAAVVDTAVVNTAALNATGFINTTANISAAVVNTAALNATGFINTTANISGATLTGSLLNVSGNVLASSMTANVMSVSATSGLTINGAIAATLADATALAIALGG